VLIQSLIVTEIPLHAADRAAGDAVRQQDPHRRRPAAAPGLWLQPLHSGRPARLRSRRAARAGCTPPCCTRWCFASVSLATHHMRLQLASGRTFSPFPMHLHMCCCSRRSAAQQCHHGRCSTRTRRRRCGWCLRRGAATRPSCLQRCGHMPAPITSHPVALHGEKADATTHVLRQSSLAHLVRTCPPSCGRTQGSKVYSTLLAEPLW
jgi:hypothetical protein